MAFFGLFGDSSHDAASLKAQAKRIEALEKTASELQKTISDLEYKLNESQLIIQYIANANNALVTDMATIYEVLKSVAGQFSEDPLAKWGSTSWGINDDDDDDDGGGWLN